MLTRVFLAAGVAALAIATPANAKPGGGQGGGNPHGGGGGPPAAAQSGGSGGGGHGHGNGGGGGAPVFAGGGGGGHGQGGGGGGPAVFMGGGGRGHGGGGPRFETRAAPQMAAPQMRVERQQMRGLERRQAQAQARGFERRQPRGIERRQAQVQSRGFERQQAHGSERRQAQMQSQALEHQQARGFERNQAQLQQRGLKQQSRGFDRRQAAQGLALAQEQSRGPQFARQAFANVNTDYAKAYYGGRGLGLINGCPPGLAAKNNGCMPPGQAAKLLGAPLASAAAVAQLAALPQPLSYYYPDTSDYYWRYGDGYLYQVNRSDNLIASLLPLIGGGYLPGQYLPADYMSSYVPDYYGLSSFYPDYGDVCNRYYGGVVYETDCATGLVEDVVPIYAGGYGVGQMLPASYGYYNVPMQYRDLYYDTPDAGYWYAPGAIYQYDPNSSVITSVAALLSPGFTIGQPLPMGYDVYNVPYAYRATYYDTPQAWYRYNNGYIYQVDPVTQIVTAIVASLLT